MILLATVFAAHAQNYLYTWTYSSPLYSGSGTLTVDPSAPENGGAGVDAYVPVISGTFNGQLITGLDTSGAYNDFLYFQNPADSSYTLTYPAQPLWQVYELAFSTTDDEYVMNGDPFGGYETFDNNNGGSGGAGDDGFNNSGVYIGNTGSFSLVSVPEPSVDSLVFGLAGVLIVWRIALAHFTRKGQS
jgi:hypothetical protein